MKTPKQSDTVVITDPGSRRRFIRSGGAILLAGATVSATANTLVADCDRGGDLGDEKNPDQPGSDSDTGANADANGCGRRAKKPKMTRNTPATEPNKHASVAVAKIKG